MSKGRKKKTGAQLLEAPAEMQIECSLDAEYAPEYEFEIDLVDADFPEMQMTSTGGNVYDVHHECPMCDAACSTRGTGYPVLMCPRCRVKMVAQPVKVDR